MYTNRFSEDNALLTGLFPDDRGPGTSYSDWVSLATYHRAFALLEIGDMATNATVYIGLQQAQDAAGTGVKAISGKVSNVHSQASGDTGTPVGIELQTEELDVDGHFEFVRMYVVTSVNTVIYSAMLFGTEPRFMEVPTTIWEEIVT